MLIENDLHILKPLPKDGIFIKNVVHIVTSMQEGPVF